MDQKDFLIKCLSETKEQYRELRRKELPEGTKEREELERQFLWEDRFIP